MGEMSLYMYSLWIGFGTSLYARLSGNGKPEVTDKYVTSYDGVAFVYIFLETLYFWVEDRACI
jgi:hypothetical protein